MYVTVYVPAVLKLGVIAPLLVFKLKLTGLELYIPPVVPIRFTFCSVLEVLQKGEL